MVTDFPRTAEAHLLQGNAFRQLGNSTQALACWQQALALAPHLSEAFTNMAILAEEKGQLTRAVAHWQQVLALDPARPGVRDSLGHTLMGLNQRDAAIEVLTEELGISPRSPRTYYLLGKIHLQEKRFPQAIAFYEKTLALDSEFTQAYYECATALVRSGRRQEAKHYREQFQQRSNEYQKKDLYGFTAEEDLQKAKRSLASLAAAAAGLYQAAGLSLLKQAVTLDPQNPKTRKRLAARYRALGQFAEALGQCERIADLQPHDPTCQMLIASLSLQLGRHRQAELAFERIVSLAPRQSYGYRELARLHLKTNNNLKQARAWAQQAVTLEPSAPNYYVLGLVCRRMGDAPAALQALQQALQRDPGNQAYQKAYRQITLSR
ncbi:MAG: tetratricopeptide repeat protein [Planctomycetes bacterium]|nr:tetratricopeptide repeat protein [Planctomycetota bacterium]